MDELLVWSNYSVIDFREACGKQDRQVVGERCEVR